MPTRLLIDSDWQVKCQGRLITALHALALQGQLKPGRRRVAARRGNQPWRSRVRGCNESRMHDLRVARDDELSSYPLSENVLEQALENSGWVVLGARLIVECPGRVHLVAEKLQPQATLLREAPVAD